MTGRLDLALSDSSMICNQQEAYHVFGRGMFVAPINAALGIVLATPAPQLVRLHVQGGGEDPTNINSLKNE